MAHSSTFKHAIFMIASLAFLFVSSSRVKAQNTYLRGALIEEFTGTWCPHCPPGAWALDTLEAKYGDNLVILAWHGGNTLPGSTDIEPLWLPNHDTLFSFFGCTGWPEGVLNRTEPVGGFGINGIPRFTQETAIPPLLKKAPTADYRIVNAAYDPAGSTVSFDVDVTPYDMTKMRSDDTTQYATIAVLAEDNVLETQANAGDWSVVPAGDLEDFHEMNVVRMVAGGAVIGDKFTLGTSNPTQTLPIRIHYSMVVDGSWDPTNIRVKTFAQATFPKNKKSITIDVLEAKQTGYVNLLPQTPSTAAWVVLPNANSTVPATKPTNIVWATSGTITNVKLEYTIDDGKTWNLIVASTSQSPYAWTIPKAALGATAKIRVSDAANAFTNGISDAFLTPGFIIVTKPAAGEIIQGGTANYIIAFTNGNLKALVKFEYSTNHGTSWTTIGSLGSADVSQYNWSNIPNPTADAPQSMIRITDANGVVGVSDTFTIKAVGKVGALAGVAVTGLDKSAPPNIASNKATTITWQNNGGDVGSGLKVEFTTDNTITWNTIGTAKPTDVSIPWTTPTGYFANGCFVRVSSTDADKANITAQSDEFSVGTSAGVAENAVNGYSISNYPNPFSAGTTITFELPVRTFVTIRIYDELGRTIDKLVTETLDAGAHSVPFNAANFSNGVYTYMLEAADGTKLTGKMSIVK